MECPQTTATTSQISDIPDKPYTMNDHVPRAVHAAQSLMTRSQHLNWIVPYVAAAVHTLLLHDPFPGTSLACHRSWLSPRAA